MNDKKVSKEIEAILQKVRKEGDRALEFYSRKFDHVKISAGDFFVPPSEIKRGYDRISGPVREALAMAKKRIELFHKFTEPVLDYYKKKGKLVKINGEQKISEIQKEIIKRIKK